MSRFTDAIDYVLENEGSEYTDDKFDLGGCTRYGITLADAILAHVGVYSCADLKAMTVDTAKTIYLQKYWKFDLIRDQRVATKMLDIFVNLPPGSAHRVFQRAANAAGAEIKCDGLWGPQTIGAINYLDPERYLEELVKQLIKYYEAVVDVRPEQAHFLAGWMNRARRLPE